MCLGVILLVNLDYMPPCTKKTIKVACDDSTFITLLNSCALLGKILNVSISQILICYIRLLKI